MTPEMIAQTQPLRVNWHDASWQKALAEALLHECTVEALGETREGDTWRVTDEYNDPATVTWSADGMACDCGGPAPCPHMARVWCHFMGSWDELEQVAWAHGIDAAVRLLVWQETGFLDRTPIRQLRPVTLRRIDGRPTVDVPVWKKFSLTGIEWGYYGAGPYDLAYSILTYFYGPAVGETFAEVFKREVIARIPRDVSEHVITPEVIREAVDDRPCRYAAGGGAQ